MSNLEQATVVLDLRFRRPAKTRKGNMALVELDADRDSCRLMTDFISSEHYDRSVSIEVELKRNVILKYALGQRAEIKTRNKKGETKTTVIESLFRAGVFLVPVSSLEVITKALEEAKEEFDAEADALVEQWDEIVDSARERLRSQFNPSKYVNKDVLRSKFSMSWRFLKYETPDANSLGDVLYKEELEKAKASWDRAEQEVVLALRAGLSDMVNHLVNQLAPKGDGSRNKLSKAAVERVSEFLALFDQRNVMKDSELKSIVDKAKKVLNGQDVEALKDQAARDSLSMKLKTVEKSLDKLVTNQKRVLNFDD